jgi:FKBP-type peptidyl-prolyl cis-trans isomerase
LGREQQSLPKFFEREHSPKSIRRKDEDKEHMLTKLKKIWVLALGLLLLSSYVRAQETPALQQEQGNSTPTTLSEKQSYAMGVELVRNLKRQGFDFDLDTVIRGMRDAFAGRKLALTDEEMLDSLNLAASQARIRRTSDQLVAGRDNRKSEEEFLAQNRNKTGVVTTPSGLQYMIIKNGTGIKPAGGDSVEVKYRGTLLDGTEFENTYESDQPATIRISDPHVIAGLREALKLMPVGARWKLFIPSRLAYGQRPAGKLIGPYSMLIYEMELVAIK